MSADARGAQPLWAQRGGAGEPLLILAHGVGTTGATWSRVTARLGDVWDGSWVAPDLRGHGLSPHAARYTFGDYAADLAALIEPGTPAVVVGHSMGASLAMCLATGWWGTEVAAAGIVSVRVSWPGQPAPEAKPAAGAGARARRESRRFDSWDDALDAYARATRLPGDAARDPEITARAVGCPDGAFRFSADPAASPTAALGAPLPMEQLKALARVPILACCGEQDHMVAPAELEPLADDVVALPGVGHYPQIERPDAVLELIGRLRAALEPRAER